MHSAIAAAAADAPGSQQRRSDFAEGQSPGCSRPLKGAWVFFPRSIAATFLQGQTDPRGSLCRQEFWIESGGAATNPAATIQRATLPAWALPLTQKQKAPKPGDICRHPLSRRN